MVSVDVKHHVYLYLYLAFVRRLPVTRNPTRPHRCVTKSSSSPATLTLLFYKLSATDSGP